MLPPWLRPQEDSTIVLVVVQPRASKTQLVGPHGDPARLKIRIAAPPVDGAANAEVVSFFCKMLGRPKSSVHLLRGESSRQKDILIEGITPQAVANAFQTELERS